MGFPLEMFPVLFAIPRTAGWLAHWQEMLDQDSKIARPRQLYIGDAGAATTCRCRLDSRSCRGRSRQPVVPPTGGTFSQQAGSGQTTH